MDKDSIILKNQQIQTEDAEKELRKLSKNNDSQDNMLLELQERLDKLYSKTNKVKAIQVPAKKSDVEEQVPEATSKISYEDLYEQAKDSLLLKGLDLEDVTFNTLLSETELAEVVEELDRPLPREDKWKRADFIVVFIAALIGGIADAVLGDRSNKFTGKNSKFSDWLNEIHESKWKHKSGAPIDFQGKIGEVSFGGGYHRELSKGHDLLRFVEGIKMFKEGKFEALGYRDGVKVAVSTAFNQNGTPYESLKLGEAILEYTHHMLADLFSNNSLPFPGYSFLRESNNRNYRTLSADMYKNGFNLKNVLIQSFSTIVIEIITRLYFSIQSVKKYRDSIEIDEDYSNWESIKTFFKPANKDKLNEMLLVAHSIVVATNAGKIIITKDISSINVTEITSVVNYGIKVLKSAAKRNNECAKILYHSSEMNKAWSDIESKVNGLDDMLIESMNETLVIA